MSTIETTLSRTDQGAEAPDGRRLRSERSRKLIVAALINLIRRGEIMPSAERVSEEAKVGLRTVYRHFEDMDSLFHEVSEHIEAEVFPIIMRPLQASDWRDQLLEIADRRAEVYEFIKPFKEHAEARRFQSAYLQERHRCAVDSETERLRSLVPEAVARDVPLFSALLAALSFDFWHRVRSCQGSSPEQAARTVRLTVQRLLAGVDAEKETTTGA